MADIISEIAGLKSLLVGVERAQRKSEPKPLAMGMTLKIGSDLAYAAGNHMLGQSLATKAAALPAMTTDVAWAGDLTTSTSGQLLLLASSQSAFASILRRSNQVDVLGPSRRQVTVLDTPEPAQIVEEGEPIPVVSGSLSGLPINPKKLAAILNFSEEMGKRSNIASVARQLLTESLAMGMDDAAFSFSGPLSLFAGVTPTTGSTSVLEDVQLLLEALQNPSPGTTFVMSTARLPMFLEAVGSSFPYPVVASAKASAANDMLAAIDPAGLAGTAGNGVIDVSKHGALHEDSEPLPLVNGVTGAEVTASPIRSFYQTNSISLRAMLDVAWKSRTGSVAYIASVGW
jgi:hypothetical protein